MSTAGAPKMQWRRMYMHAAGRTTQQRRQKYEKLLGNGHAVDGTVGKVNLKERGDAASVVCSLQRQEVPYYVFAVHLILHHTSAPNEKKNTPAG